MGFFSPFLQFQWDLLLFQWDYITKYWPRSIPAMYFITVSVKFLSKLCFIYIKQAHFFMINATIVINRFIFIKFKMEIYMLQTMIHLNCVQLCSLEVFKGVTFGFERNQVTIIGASLKWVIFKIVSKKRWYQYKMSQCEKIPR